MAPPFSTPTVSAIIYSILADSSPQGISAEGWVIIIAALGANIVLPIINLILQFVNKTKTTRVEQKVDAAASKVEAATDAVAQAQTQVAEVHTMVNGNMLIQLKANAELARRLANVTRDPKDAAIAADAEKRYQAHCDKESA